MTHIVKLRSNYRHLDHLLYYWRAGASQPSRTTGTIYIYIAVSVLSVRHTVLFYVNLNLRNFTAIENRSCAPYRVLLCTGRSGVRE